MTVEEASAISEYLGEIPNRPSAEIEGKIPLFGFAAASDGDRVALTHDQVLDWLDPPISALKSVPTGALRVAGESMEPRLFQGETVFFSIGVPPMRGRDCVVEFKNDTALVKTYQQRKDGRVYLKQWNPEHELVFPWDEIRALHAVTLRL